MIAKNESDDLSVVKVEVTVTSSFDRVSLGAVILLSDGTQLTHLLSDEELEAAVERLSDEARMCPDLVFGMKIREILEQIIPPIAERCGMSLGEQTAIGPNDVEVP